MNVLIFDLDGTLVDSEPLCNQAFLNLLPDLDDSLDRLTHRYRGIKLALILADLEKRLGRPLPADFVIAYRAEVAVLFERELQAVDGAAEALSLLGNRKCIASSGPLAKITHSLALTGLARFFGENVFSAYEVGSWKPDPGLFLHAARVMGVSPSDCIVIEDSAVGLAAANAAGMRSIHFDPEGTGADLFEVQSNEPVDVSAGAIVRASNRVTSLSELPDLVALFQSGH